MIATTTKAHLIANSRSGKGKGATLADEAQKICDELHIELIRYDISSKENFEKQSRLAVENAKKDNGVVIAAGGDGTIRGVAQAAHGTGVKFAAVPCGTFNFFARTHRIPEDSLEAFRLAVTGNPRRVRLGEINGLVFLINASLGLYAKAIRERESRTRKFGRNRIVVIFSTIISLLSSQNPLKVDLVMGSELKSLKTPMIFIGNNSLQLRNLAMNVSRCMKLDLLAVVLMRSVTKFEALRILLRGIFKTIENDEKLDSFCVDSLTIYTHRPRHEIALDGEIFSVNSPLKVRALPEVLNLVLPPPEVQT